MISQMLFDEKSKSVISSWISQKRSNYFISNQFMIYVTQGDIESIGLEVFFKSTLHDSKTIFKEAYPSC